jgi:uncharacterized protein
VELTTTSYALLGLLALRPWTTYELANQVQRGLRGVWPVAERQLYEQPKTLVAHGLATAHRERTGDRPRTVYRITPQGLSDPSGGLELRSELLLKVFFAEHTDRKTLLDHISNLRSQATSARDGQVSLYEANRDTGFPFPDRRHLSALVARLGFELQEAIDRWADWAEHEIAGWTDDLAAPDDADELLERVYVRSVDHPARTKPRRLTADMQRVVLEQRLGFVATTGPDGRPNLSPKGTTTVWDDRRLLFADVASPRTVANLATNPHVVVNVVDPIVRKGYRFRGTATVHTRGRTFERGLEILRGRGSTTPREAIHSLVVIDVTEVDELVSPAYDTGATEEEVTRRWLEHHAALHG